MTKLITSVIALTLLALAQLLAESNRINRRIVKLEIQHNRLLQEKNIELQVHIAALSEISRSIDQAWVEPMPQNN